MNTLSPLASLRALALQTHLELMHHLQHPLYRHVATQITQDQIQETILEIIRAIHREKVKP